MLKRRPINEREPSKLGLGWFLFWLFIAGIVAGGSYYVYAR